MILVTKSDRVDDEQTQKPRSPQDPFRFDVCLIGAMRCTCHGHNGRPLREEVNVPKNKHRKQSRSPSPHRGQKLLLVLQSAWLLIRVAIYFAAHHLWG